MPRLIVKNVGPIKDVDLELSKINVFMGPQSCGKSTLAKIISSCSWIEKRKFWDDRETYMPLAKLLCSYHKLGSEPFQEGSYIQRDSRIAYLGDNVNYFLNYTEKEAKRIAGITHFQDQYVGENEIIYFLDSRINPKVIYIPSERNFVSRVPNLGDYNDAWDNLQGFVRAWFEAKSHYDVNHHLPLLDLPVSFFTDDQGVNYIAMDGGNQLKLESASSGLQSVVPLLTMVTWLSQGIYQKEKPYSPSRIRQLAS